MTTISTSLQVVLARIAAAALAVGRHPDEIQLIAVSKTWPAPRVRDARTAGIGRFGESYVQEALGKISVLQELGIEWHFIGALQGNKARRVAEHFAWVHTIDRVELAERLAKTRPASLGPLNVCLQVNISNEASKSGVAPSEVANLAARVARLRGIRLRGLMAIPRATRVEQEQRAQFRAMRTLFEALKTEGFPLDTLSMGMSEDLEAAIAEGATMVRVGTALFGSRDAH